MGATPGFQYTYDATGYYHWPAYLPSERVAQLREELDQLGWEPSSFPHTQRINDIAQRTALIGELARELFESDWLEAVMTYPHRLIESYALERSPAGRLPLHGGAGERLTRAGHPEAEDISCSYWFRSGRMYSLRAKALVYLDPIGCDEDGPLVYVEGSHKANFPFMQTFASGARCVDECGELVRRIATGSGSLVVLNEAVVHGALQKLSVARRRVLIFTFAPTFVADWSELGREESGPLRRGYIVPDTEDSH